jgi:hypothetical protein
MKYNDNVFGSWHAFAFAVLCAVFAFRVLGLLLVSRSTIGTTKWAGLTNMGWHARDEGGLMAAMCEACVRHV